MAEKARLEKEMSKADADIKRVDAKLGNPDFVKRAPEEIIDGEREKREQSSGMNSHVEWPRYFSRTRVPRIFWLLSALRKFGTRRSISSKYDDRAGVFCCAL